MCCYRTWKIEEEKQTNLEVKDVKRKIVLLGRNKRLDVVPSCINGRHTEGFLVPLKVLDNGVLFLVVESVSEKKKEITIKTQNNKHKDRPVNHHVDRWRRAVTQLHDLALEEGGPVLELAPVKREVDFLISPDCGALIVSPSIKVFCAAVLVNTVKWL